MSRKRSSYYDAYWPSYEATRPRDADGIKAKGQRGDFTATWWGRQWLEALTPLMDSGRLSRGRSYARRGQVLEINIQPGKVTARVQGSRPTPYKVAIELKPLNDGQWGTVLEALAGQAIYAAQLLNGEMPDDIESIFNVVKVPLFPESRGDLGSECSCPDWANPCKHVAAVYYLLGERFDADPFLLFTLRGRNKEQIAAELRKRRASGTPVSEAPAPFTPDAIAVEPVAPLTESLGQYWGSARALAAFSVQIAEPPVALALLKRVGLPDFIEREYLRIQLERIYPAITEYALAVAFSEHNPEGEPEEPPLQIKDQP